MTTNPVLAMLTETLPAGRSPHEPEVQAMLRAVPPAMWNGYNLAQTPEGRAGSLEMLRGWVAKFGLALI